MQPRKSPRMLSRGDVLLIDTLIMPQVQAALLLRFLVSNVRDRLSRKASTNSNTGICNWEAICSRVFKLGEASPFNHFHQFFTSMPVSCFNLAYDKVKNSCLVIGFLTNVSDTIKKYFIGFLINIAQTIRHPLERVSFANLVPCWSRVKSHNDYNSNTGTACTHHNLRLATN